MINVIRKLDAEAVIDIVDLLTSFLSVAHANDCRCKVIIVCTIHIYETTAMHNNTTTMMHQGCVEHPRLKKESYNYGSIRTYCGNIT